jgi:hypothetical protein
MSFADRAVERAGQGDVAGAKAARTKMSMWIWLTVGAWVAFWVIVIAVNQPTTAGG